jgi:heat shock protein HslJ
MRKFAILTIILVAAAALLYVFLREDAGAENEKQARYTIDGVSLALDDSFRYFGNEVRKDLNGDGREDLAFLVTHQPGGTGTFYYVVAALNTAKGYVGSKGYLLGDRIAPQTTESGPDATIIVNFADRKPDEPFTAQPSVGKSARLMFDAQAMRFVDASDGRLALVEGKDFILESVLYDGENLNLENTSIRISFDEGAVSGMICNSFNGAYSIDEQGRMFAKNIAATKKYCEGDLMTAETEFFKALDKGVTVASTEDGVTLTSEQGTVFTLTEGLR